MEEYEIKRQAVIIIHGMGEQRPMESLRNFTNGVKQYLGQINAQEKKATLRSKVDSVGDIYETNRLSLEGVHEKRPPTDFYEFYWAHNMRNTKVEHMLAWLKKLVFTRVSVVPPRLRVLFYSIWSITALVVLIVIYLFITNNISWVKTLIAAISSIALVSLLFSFVATFFKSIFLKYAGDAARYFTPVPDNVEERVKIRRQGIAFLKKLHELVGRQKPDRIIIVAHSLGSVVAYDLLKILWTEYDDSHAALKSFSQKKLEELNKFIKNQDNWGEAELEKFRMLQFECWKEQRLLGNKWLISDFITLGAAINAADYFVLKTAGKEELIAQREWPVCPPCLDADDNSIFYHLNYQTSDLSKRSVKVLHHGAPFAVTRWTNIYYTSDFVGGSASRVFGQGVKDVPIKRKSLWFMPGGHTKYWDKMDANNAIKQIVEAMQLDQ